MTEGYQAHKQAKLLLRAGDAEGYASAALRAIPAIPGLAFVGPDIAARIADWVVGRQPFSTCSDDVRRAIHEVSPSPAEGALLAKWLLSVGMFRATEDLQQGLFERFAGGGRLRRFVERSATPAVAVQTSDQVLLKQAARGGRRRIEDEVSLSDVARLATGSRVDTARPDRFADFVAGRSVGILGPAPLSEADKAAVMAADIVAAAVAPTHDADRLSVNECVDVAYVLPWSGNLPVDWRPDGILAIRGSDPVCPPTGFEGKLRRCRSVRASGLVGHPTAVPDIVVDLLLAGAADIRVAGVNFYISTTPPYRSSATRFGLDEWNSAGRPFFATSMFSTHPPIENRNLVRTLALSGRLVFLGETADVIEMPACRAAETLESAWSLPRR